MGVQILCFAGAAFRRALWRAGCIAPVSRSAFLFETGNGAALLHHEGRDHDLAEQFWDGGCHLRGLDLLGLFAQKVGSGAGSNVSRAKFEWEGGIANFRCMACGVRLVVCGQLPAEGVVRARSLAASTAAGDRTLPPAVCVRSVDENSSGGHQAPRE